MDDPVRDAPGVVHKLIQGSPKEQEDAINAYFTPDAEFMHPFCRTGSFEGSRLLVHAIFRWYKIMSPRIDAKVNSIAFDESNLILYINLTQIFAIWAVPFHRSHVTVTTQLRLRKPPNSGKYYIAQQNDLYQVDQFVRFFLPWGIGTSLVYLWHFWATFFCVLGMVLFMPVTWLEQRWAGEKGSQWARGDYGSSAAAAQDGEKAGGRDSKDVRKIMEFAAESGKEEVQRLVDTARKEAQEAEVQIKKEMETHEEKPNVEQYGKMQVVH